MRFRILAIKLLLKVILLGPRNPDPGTPGTDPEIRGGVSNINLGAGKKNVVFGCVLWVWKTSVMEDHGQMFQRN